METRDSVPSRLSPEVCVRALEARDARFDGVFFVGITSTRIYCRPICPARVSRPENRRFFRVAAAAEGAGFRPCRRCRPELAPGNALVDAVSRLAFAAERRIAEGALNGRPVRELARELFVGERHLRRALRRELGVSPIQLAQTHRLLLAKRLLTDTHLPVTQVAYASGFQSLRRFNALFRKCYGMTPRTLRRGPRRRKAGPSPHSGTALGQGTDGFLRISLAYRKPFNWPALLDCLRVVALPEVEVVTEATYGRTVVLDGHEGLVFVSNNSNASSASNTSDASNVSNASHASNASNGDGKEQADGCLDVDVSPSLIPALMPLIARLRHLFDLDAEPAVIEEVLEAGGLGEVVRRFPGVRIPGSFDPFEYGLGLLLRSPATGAREAQEVARRVVTQLGTPTRTTFPGLAFFAPAPERLAAAGKGRLQELGLSGDHAHAVVSFARAVSEDMHHLRPGGDPQGALSALMELPGFDEQRANSVVGRTLAWPDHFDSSDRLLQRATGAGSAEALEESAERWRPWRAYAARLLRMSAIG